MKENLMTVLIVGLICLLFGSVIIATTVMTSNKNKQKLEVLQKAIENHEDLDKVKTILEKI